MEIPDIQYISDYIESKLDEKIIIPKNDGFSCKKIPRISIYYFLKRIYRYLTNIKIENENEYNEDDKDIIMIILAGIFYLNRVPIILNNFNIHKLLLVSILCAHKYIDDEYTNNDDYSYIGGISLYQMNKLELRMCKIIDYNFSVTIDDIYLTLSRMEDDEFTFIEL